MHGNGWEPYTLSLRIVNWVKWYQRSGLSDSTIVSSIELQAQALSKQLEYHILGNHLFANGKALVFVGCFLSGDIGEKYRSVGLKILEREVPEQFLEDGGHFELSPMYHCTLLWDMLDLLNLAKLTDDPCFGPYSEKWQSVVERGLQWLDAMTHPDGQISFFNDSAFGIAPEPKWIVTYAEELGLRVPRSDSPIQILLATGYSKVVQRDHTLIFDHGAVGPDYLPAHAHADTLSLEWSVGIDRVFVNSGTSLYGVSAERHRQRQTASHNTVVVDDEDSSEVWGGFRVARRAYAQLEKQTEENGRVALVASHDGYRRLKGKVIHRRALDVFERGLVVSDSLSGKFSKAEAHYHLHPAIRVIETNESRLLLETPSGQRLQLESGVPFRLEGSTWHPRFGESVQSQKLIIPFQSSSSISIKVELLN
ncbi:hypothetical protein GCM10009092_17530 [Bowmanella denitrificans]|uniref:Heparinase n=2 Tax=Bowmanella denitrificans TaxID=366582 RepID=A0ABP3GSD1_9ALTE